MRWNFRVLAIFNQSPGWTFSLIIEIVNRLASDIDTETVRKFLDDLANHGYLKKNRDTGLSVYSRTEKMKDLITEAQNFLITDAARGGLMLEPV